MYLTYLLYQTLFQMVLNTTERTGQKIRNLDYKITSIKASLHSN
jgi:hypothetical protein